MKRQGSALLLITTVSALLLLVAIAAGVNAVSDINVTQEEKTRTALEFACESGLNRAKTKIEESFNNQDLNNLEPFVTFQGNEVDDTGFSPQEKAYDDEGYYLAGETYYYNYNMTAQNGAPLTVVYSIKNGRDNDLDGWLKTQGYTTNKMLIEAAAYSSKLGWLGMSENVYARRTSLFMYQIFFQNDLEILPGPNFNLTGLIHTNENMYLNSNNNLKIYSDSVTAAGDIFRGRLDSSDVNGHVYITSQNHSGTLTEMNAGVDSQNSNWVNLATNNWKGSVKDKSLGASYQAAPDLKSIEPGGYYDQNAGLNIKVITTGANPVYEIKYGSTTITKTSAELNNALQETVINDYRENPSGTPPSSNKKTKVTNVDINKLKTALSNYYPSNGLIYMTRDDAIPDQNNNPYTADPSRVVSGFKLVNSTTLPAATTFVTNLPVYVQGTFNKHSSTNPALDTWKPCAVVSDAITLLSNSWVDSNSNWKDPAVVPLTTMPTASNSEYNFVFITGNIPTKPGQYNGGLENFPRFLENWSGKTVDISGGFIQLFRSAYATGPWSYGNYYQAPTRNWKSEPRFSNLNDLPPEFVDMFPSAAISVTYSDYKQVNKNDTDLGDLL
jgi:hypothetical protein